MAHVHDEDRSSYYLEQLCAIAVCGAFVGVCVLLWWLRNYTPDAAGQSMLRIMLKPAFHLPVLLGGLALGVMVVIRAVAVWSSVARPKAQHTQDHDHCHDDGHCHEQEHAPAQAAHDHAAGEACAHDHVHNHEAAEATGHHQHAAHGDSGSGHSHSDCGHSHDWSPWRYAVLLLPIVLYFLGLPNKLPSEEAVDPNDLGQTSAKSRNAYFGIQLARTPQQDGFEVTKLVRGSQPLQAGLRAGDIIKEIKLEAGKEGKPVVEPQTISTRGMSLDDVSKLFQDENFDQARLVIARPGSDKPLEFEINRKAVLGLDFKELDKAAWSQEQRDWYQGRIGRLKGQFAPSSNPKIFSLVRFKMACCAADAIPLKAVIEAPENVTHVKAQDWVEVEGQIEFRKMRGRDEYVPFLSVSSMKNIQKAPPEPDLYLQ